MSSNLPCSRAKNWFHSLAAGEIGVDFGIRKSETEMWAKSGWVAVGHCSFSSLYNELEIETRFGSEIACHGSISGPPHLLWIKQEELGGKMAESVQRRNFPQSTM